ncbi:MAG: hypothetical protein JSS04_11975 [Proteobacteria bacterium]|nr:hypothetical protein [Pseudomonadota bacterium]
MADTKTFLFRIDKCTPETLPMARLAEYMRQFAIVLGEIDRVHFEKVVPGSTTVRALVEREAVPTVNMRVRATSTGTAPSDAMFALGALDKMLTDDNSSGSIRRLEADDLEEEMIRLLGADKELAPTFGPISQATTLDGKVIRVGGRQQEVPVHIETRTGIESHCFATRAMAKEFGKRLFDGEFRFYGEGKWLRDEMGKWKLQRFNISRFEPLDESRLSDALMGLRAIEGRDWSRTDPWAELREIRGTDPDDET